MPGSSLSVKSPCPAYSPGKRHRSERNSFLLRFACWVLLAMPRLLPAQYVYATNNGTITITQYTGPGGVVSVPSVIDNLPVTTIAGFAFLSHSNVTAVLIPEGINEIGFEAFFACNSLGTVALPSTVNRIGDGAFQNCTNLISIDVEASNPVFRSVDGVLFTSDQTTLLAYPGGKSGAFVGANPTRNIGVGAFGGAVGLTSVWLPDTVTNVSDSAFYSCSRLASVIISNGVKYIGNSSFYSCVNLTNVDTGLEVVQIGDYAFASCGALATARLGTAITNIGYGAFSGSGLTALAIPDSVRTLGDAAFEYCSNLTSVIIGNSLGAVPNFAFDACTRLTSLTLGNSIANIGVDAFGRCSSLASLTIPAAVTNIDDAAFLNCAALQDVFFMGNPPATSGIPFSGDSGANFFYLPRASGWGRTYAGLPALPWNLQAETQDPSFGIRSAGFGFKIAGPTNVVIVVETSTDPSANNWTPLQTNTLTTNVTYFADPQWTNYAARFYRMRPSR